MSALSGIRKYSRTLAKGTLYGAGAIALGWPAIKAAKVAYTSGSIDDGLAWGLYEATGYSVTQNRFVPEQTKVTVVRDIVGVASLFVASKL